MGDSRKDYGPAGCADGCASRSVQLMVAVGLLFALLRKRKGGR